MSLECLAMSEGKRVVKKKKKSVMIGAYQKTQDSTERVPSDEGYIILSNKIK